MGSCQNVIRALPAETLVDGLPRVPSGFRRMGLTRDLDTFDSLMISTVQQDRDEAFTLLQVRVQGRPGTHTFRVKVDPGKHNAIQNFQSNVVPQS